MIIATTYVVTVPALVDTETMCFIVPAESRDEAIKVAYRSAPTKEFFDWDHAETSECDVFTGFQIVSDAGDVDRKISLVY